MTDPVTLPVVPARLRRRVRMPVRVTGEEAVEAVLHTFDGLSDGLEHVVLTLDAPEGGPSEARLAPLVRVHSECLTGDVLGSVRCDCGPQLEEALVQLSDEGGFLVYLRQEGRGIGLYNKIDAYALQDEGLDTFEANEALGFASDERRYEVAAQMLLALGVTRVRLLTNNPDKATQLRAAGVSVEACRPTGLHLSSANRRYLTAKAFRGHRLLGLLPAVTQADPA